MTAFVRRLQEALAEHGRQAWVDWEDIPLTAEWWAEIERGIQAAHAFIFVLSPDSVRSEVCRRELACAIDCNKRLVPIVRGEVEAEQVPPALAALNWVFFRESDDFDAAFGALLTALDTDLDWVHSHTRLLVRAAEWERRGKNASFLLRGSDLREAEQWLLDTGPNKQPTTLQTEYVFASRRAERGRQRLTLGAVSIAAVVATGLAIFGWIQRGQAIEQGQIAEERRRVAVGRQLAAQAVTFADTRLDLALLLGLVGERIADTPEVRGGLLSAVTSQPHLRTILHGHAGQANGVAYTPDGRQLVSAGVDGLIRVWDARLSQQVRAIPAGQGGQIMRLALSPDGTRMATLHTDPEVRLWDLASGQLISTLSGHRGSVRGVAFSPDGTRLASGGADGTIRLWDGSGAGPSGEPLDGGGEVWGLAFSPDGTRLVSSSDGGGIRLWDLPMRQVVGALGGPRESAVAVAFSPDGSKIAAGVENNVRLWGAAGGDPIATLQGHTAPIISLAFSPNGQWLVSGGADRTVRLWSVAASQPGAEPWAAHGGTIAHVAFSPDSSRVASVGIDGKIVIWGVSAISPVARVLGSHEGDVWSVAITRNGSLIASGGADKAVRLWSSAGAPFAPPLTGHTDVVTTVAFHPDKPILASGSRDGTVRVWGPELRLIGSLPAHASGVRAVAFAPDGSALTSAGMDDAVRTWSMSNGQLVGEPLAGFGGWVGSLAYSPDGSLLAVGGADGEIRLISAGGRSTLRAHDGGVLSLTFSADGRLLASGGEDGAVNLWKVADGQRAGQPMTGHASWVWSVAFAPDGASLASAGRDGTVRLWDLASQQQLGKSVICCAPSFTSVAFSGDGATLVAGGGDRRVQAAPTRPAAWRDTACRRANRNLTESEWRQFVADEPYRVTCPAVLAAEGAAAVRSGDGATARADFTQATEAAIRTEGPQANNAVCWTGSLHDHAAVVMPACDRAVQLAPGEAAYYQDSRGLARALTGDPRGAIEDFRAFVEWTRTTGRYEELRPKRERFIAELEAGRNPFDASTLEDLRNE